MIADHGCGAGPQLRTIRFAKRMHDPELTKTTSRTVVPSRRNYG